MPCWNMARFAKRERERIEKDRADALTRIEEELAAGIANLVVDPLTGEVLLLDATPIESMTDVCVLAALQTRNSIGFQVAVTQAQAQGVDFVSLHGNSHSH